MNNTRRKVCIILVDRANYGRLKPVMQSIKEHPDLELQIIAAGTMVLERFDLPINIVKNDGFIINGEIYIELEGSTPTTMAKSLGFAIIEFASEIHRLNPDIVLLIGDRYEALAASLAAAYMNKCICHIQGGEVSGSIDESARHVITKLAHFHLPATKRSAEYILRMGERPDTILGIGCPSSDIAFSFDRTLTQDIINKAGHGPNIDFNSPFLLVIFHPTTTEYGNERKEMDQLLEALNCFRIQTLLLWPNIDAGADHISKAIRVFRNKINNTWLRTMTNIGPEYYLKVLANTSCAVGNSSSFVRDASYFGTPVVLVGNRQEGRETDAHVISVPSLSVEIANAIKRQLSNGRYGPSTLYGDGYVSRRIANQLSKIEIYTQKRLHYIYDQPEVRKVKIN